MTIISLDPIHSLTANVNKLQNLANKPCKHLRDELFIMMWPSSMGDLSKEWRQDWSLEFQCLSLEASCWCESNGIMRVILPEEVQWNPLQCGHLLVINLILISVSVTPVKTKWNSDTPVHIPANFLQFSQGSQRKLMKNNHHYYTIQCKVSFLIKLRRLMKDCYAIVTNINHANMIRNTYITLTQAATMSKFKFNDVLFMRSTPQCIRLLRLWLKEVLCYCYWICKICKMASFTVPLY